MRINAKRSRQSNWYLAKVIGISLDYLLLMESVSLKIPVNEYIYAIQKLQAYKNKQLIEKQRANKI